jgi:hypothetical protein
MGYIPLASRGAVVWSDDFTDGDYDGWTICDNQTLYRGEWGWSGSSWSAANHYLQIEAGYGQAGWGIISHPSNVAYGKWRFDFKTDETQIDAGVLGSFRFISGNFYDWSDYDTDSNLYNLGFDAIATAEGFEMSLYLGKRVDGVSTDIVSSDALIPIAGWHQIEVTRTTTGLFSVYHNGSLMLQAVDTDHTTSVMFWLWFGQGSMTDNIVVDDAPPPDLLLIAIIGAAAVVIIVVLVIFLKRR